MKTNKASAIILVVIVLIVAGTGAFIYSGTPKGLSLDNALHHWLHKPVIAKVMEWTGLTEETVLAGRKVYWCPMHPQVNKDKPGACPICNMQLVEADENSGQGIDDGSIQITSRQIQQAGVRFTTVTRIKFTRPIETTGRVVADERLLKTISSWAPGKSRIERLYVNFTGARVRKGEPLVSIYNSDFVTTQEEYLMLLKGGATRLEPLVKSVEERLKRWGISAGEIKKIRKNAKPMEKLIIYSPMSGVVIERMVDEGQYVTEGKPLLKLADLSRLWVYGDVYENELSLIKTGMPVKISIQGKSIDGKINFIDPVVQNDSRTVRVRFEVSNKDRLLKPGMFANVRIDVFGDDVLAVPASAVLFTGRRAIVMVWEGAGAMFPVEVELGRKWVYAMNQMTDGKSQPLLGGEDRYHEVLSGLDEGEEVVSSANFLIAAEAQFQGALKKLAPEQTSESSPDSQGGI
ncbi:Probable Co/Zn/Cd efflux system membrane fusion protein [hydrothermal vent metagenome]|uniref:Probable Co/Zn/Cd efflux system membrane fusion protein n=1 Tax=hydrothermal vent metagenome TaxID=652676 RepID=A0A3B1CVV7_9ZZZZ